MSVEVWRYDEADPIEGTGDEVRRLDLLDTSLRKGLRFDEETGFLHGRVRPTRTGVFKYRRADGSISYELKHPDDVFEDASLETLKRIVLTHGHPRRDDGGPLDVTSENVDFLSVGHGGDSIGREVVADEEHPIVGVTVTKRHSVTAIRNGDDEVSMGYKTVLVDESGVYKGVPYNARHRRIRYNHMAVALPRGGGRGGRTVNFTDRADAADEALFAAERREDTTMEEIEIDGVKIRVENAASARVVQNALEKRQAKADDAEKRLTDATKERDTLQAKVDAAEQEKAEASKKQDSEPKFAARFREVQGLHLQALQLLGVTDAADEKAKPVLDALEKAIDSDTPTLAIKRVALGDSAKDKSEAYVDAMWDLKVEQAKAGQQSRQDSTTDLAIATLNAGRPGTEDKRLDAILEAGRKQSTADPLVEMAKSGAKGVLVAGVGR